LMDEDPRKLINNLKIPISIIHCGNDCQIYKEDFDIWKAKTKGMKNVSLKEFPSLNHLLSNYSKSSTGEEYSERLPLDKSLASFIVEWILNITYVKHM